MLRRKVKKTWKKSKKKIKAKEEVLAKITPEYNQKKAAESDLNAR